MQRILLIDSGPAVAGRNATRRQPEYRNWRLFHSQNAPMEPHLEQQILSIHQRFRVDQVPAALNLRTSHSSPATLSPMPFAHSLHYQSLPSPSSTTQTPRAENVSQRRSLQYTENTSHNMLSGMPSQNSSPSYSPLQRIPQSVFAGYNTASNPSLVSSASGTLLVEIIKLLLKTVIDLNHHILYSRNALSDECYDLLRAMITFESDYEKKPFTIEIPRSAPERFRSATAHILYIRHHHQLTLENLGKVMRQIHECLSRAGQEDLVPHDWRVQETQGEGNEEKSDSGDVKIEKEADH